MSSELPSVRFDRRLVGVCVGSHQADARGKVSSAGREADGASDLLRRKEESLRRKEAELLRLEEELNQEKDTLREKTNQMCELIESLKHARAEMLEAHEEDIVSLSLSISEKVLDQEIQNGAYKVGEVLRSALHGLRDKGEILVKVNPQDYELAKAAVEEIRRSSGFSRVTMAADETVPLASCCIESESGKVFSSIAQRLAKIEANLLQKDGGGDGV